MYVCISDKHATEEVIQSNQEEYEKHVESVTIYEMQARGELVRKRQRKKRQREDDYYCMPEREEVVTGDQTSILEARKLLGILWPTDIFEAHEHRKPSEQEVG